jgi:branched-chain amino acid transport system permease protein
MFYRASRRLPTAYSSQFAIIKRPEDRILAALAIGLAVVAVPEVTSTYVLSTLLVPLLILSIAATGLNLLMGYAGQASLGSGAFMAVGAYTSYKLATNVPQIPVMLDFFIGGLVAAVVGVVFGLPSLKMRAFYLAIATLAVQFFVEWLFSKVSWFWNGHASGVISTPSFSILGLPVDTPVRGYYFLLAVVVLMTIVAINLTRSHIGRRWMAVRDNETAAQLMGISVAKAKLTAFAISSFYCGVAGALWAFVFLRSLGITSYSIDTSFKIMFMIIIGGLGSIMGSFLGAAFVLLVPITLNIISASMSLPLTTGTLTCLEQICFGILIIYFVVIEPEGIVRTVRNFHEKLVSWPLTISR